MSGHFLCLLFPKLIVYTHADLHFTLPCKDPIKLEIKCAVCFISYWNLCDFMISKYYSLSSILAFFHLHPGCWMTSGFHLVHWWQQILPRHLRKGEKTVIIYFRFIHIWRQCIDWGSLLTAYTVSIVRSEVLPYNKRSYFNHVQNPIIAGNPQQGKSHWI